MPKQENMKVEDIEELKEEMEVLEEQLMHNHRIDPNLYLEYDVKRGPLCRRYREQCRLRRM